MTVFIVATLKFTDVARYRAYQARFADVFHGCGGALLAAEEDPLRLEGHESPDKIVIMQFDDADQASAFLLSDAYQAISKDREAGSVTVTHMIKGLVPPLR